MKDFKVGNRFKDQVSQFLYSCGNWGLEEWNDSSHAADAVLCWPDAPPRLKSQSQLLGMLLAESPLLALPARIALGCKELPQQRSLSSLRWACPQRQTDMQGVKCSPLVSTQDDSAGPRQLHSSHAAGWALAVTASQLNFSLCPGLLPPSLGVDLKGMP